MHACLVDDHVRELGQVVLDVLDPPAADDLRPVLRVRLPEDRFVDPVRFLEQPLGEPERVEHLDGTTGNAVGLAKLERARPAIDDAGLDVGEGSQLRSEDEAGRTATDDQDVHFVRQGASDASIALGAAGEHFRVPDPVPVE